MNYRTLGRTGLRVSEIGFGAWGIGGVMWQDSDDRESTRALEAALDLGLNFIDTGLAYGDGHSERLIAKVLRDRKTSAPHPVVVATKIPPKNHEWPTRRGVPLREVFPAEYIRECTVQSLRNLGRDALDLQQLHVWSPDWLREEEWLREVDKLRAEGKVRCLGVSVNDHEPGSALELVRSGHVDTVQVICNIFDQSPEVELFPLCRKMRVGVIARCPFDEGALAGKITPETRFPRGDWRNQYFRGDRKKQVFERVQKLEAAIAGKIATLPEAALRFCLRHAAVSTVIPGMRTAEHARENCRVSDGEALPAELLATLREHAWPKNFYA